MADINAYGTPDPAAELSGGVKGPYWGDSFIGAFIVPSSAVDILAVRTLDGGATWAALSVAPLIR